jgi:hypothetical protein
MADVYAGLRGLALAPRACEELRGDADPLTPDGLLRSALLAFEN